MNGLDKTTILIIDDNPKNIQVVASILRAHTDYNILFALDGKEGLHRLNKNDISLILLDINIPGVNGYQIAKSIKSNPQTSSIPIVFLSANSDHESIEKGFEYGCNDYITKPFHSHELLQRVETHVRLFQTEKRLENEVSKSHFLLNQYKEVIDLSTLVFKTDTKGTITYVNKLLCETSQYSKFELLGESADRVIEDGFLDAVLKNEAAGSYWQGVLNNRKKDGTSFITSSVGMPLYNEEGDVVEIICASKDISAELEAKCRLESVNKQLEEKVFSEVAKNKKKDLMIEKHSKNAAMGEMLSMIAHQWRQPLTTISVLAANMMFDLAMDKYKSESFKERLEKITDVTQHLSNTINDFRKFFKEDKQLSAIIGEALIEECLALIGPSLEVDGIKIIRSYEEPSITIETYPGELKQALLNILKNAQDVLSVRGIPAPYITIALSSSETSLSISIQDNGNGIDDTIIDKIFDPYFTTKGEHNGTGLGLYMTKTIIEEHCKGKLNVINSDEGACFEIMLPRNFADPFIETVMEHHHQNLLYSI